MSKFLTVSWTWTYVFIILDALEHLEKMAALESEANKVFSVFSNCYFFKHLEDCYFIKHFLINIYIIPIANYS